MALPLINGVNYSAASVNVIIPALPTQLAIGVVSIEYSKDQTIEDAYGLLQDPISRGFGQNKYMGSIELLKDTWNQIIAASPFRDPAKLGLFDITVTYTGSTTGGVFVKEVLRSVSFKNNPSGTKSGDTKLTCKIELAVGNIDY